MALSPCLQTLQWFIMLWSSGGVERPSIPFQACLTSNRSAMWMLHNNRTPEKSYTTVIGMEFCHEYYRNRSGIWDISITACIFFSALGSEIM